MLFPLLPATLPEFPVFGEVKRVEVLFEDNTGDRAPVCLQSFRKRATEEIPP